MKECAFVLAMGVSTRRGTKVTLYALALFVASLGMISRVDAENNTSYIYNGTTTNLGAFTIGNNGTNNVLEISNGGAVTNTIGTLGTGANGSFNSAYVTNVGSIWVNTGDWQSGNDYPANSNRLVIADSGTMQSLNGYLGYYGSYNSGLIDGAGSVWNITGAGNGYFELGIYGHHNSLVITNGGLLNNTPGYSIIGVTAGASNNIVTVTGAGSQWTNASHLYVGYGSPYSELRIEDGGRVDNFYAFIGQYTAGQVAGYGSYSNYICVSGPNSLWNNRADLYLGYNAGGNTMVITNGGRVNNVIGQLGYLHANSGSNTVIVTGVGSVWSNSNYLINGNTAGDNHMIITDGGRVDVLYYLQGYSDNNTLLMSGSNTLFNMPASSFEVGLGGKNNTAVISNGARVVSFDGYVGNGAITHGSGDVLTFTGAGTLWTNTGPVYVGYQNVHNETLNILDGAKVYNSSAALGQIATATNSTVVVDGPGSLWNNSSSLYVGNLGGGNTLIITNGGRVNNALGQVGLNTAASGHNNVIVTGSGSVWSNVNQINLGSSGGTNSLSITQGGRVDAQYILIGDSHKNSLLIDGAGSLLNVPTSSFILGRDGRDNVATVSDGARLNSLEGYLGYNNASGGNNLMTVTDPGSVWSNTGILYVGHTPGGNQLAVSNQASLYSSGDLYVGNQGAGNKFIVDGGSTATIGGIGYVGYNTSASNSSVQISGNNTLVNLGSYLYFSVFAHDNTLSITDGARLNNGNGSVGAYIGGSGSASNLSILASGAGTVWSNNGTLFVGYASSNVSLTISDGAKVYNGAAYVGFFNNGSTLLAGGERVTVTGPGSEWNNSAFVNFGYQGGGNSLIISNGGYVKTESAPTGYSLLIGDQNANAGNNLVVVTGQGSILTNTGGIQLGSYGSSNQFIVSDGGRVYAQHVIIGYPGVGTGNNLLRITGSNSLMSIDSASPGYGYIEPVYGPNNQIIIDNGGRLNDIVGYIGGSVAGSNTVVLVTGAGSVWSNSSTLFAGYAGPSNRVVVANGGRLESAAAIVGYLYNGSTFLATNNVVEITGSGSVWNNNGQLYMGYNAPGNYLIVTNGGRLNSGTVPTGVGTYVGGYGSVDANNQTIHVSGAGSTWSNAGAIYFGHYAPSNRLIISDGGRVDSGYGYIGVYDGPIYPTLTGSYNSVVVTGSNSLWNVAGQAGYDYMYLGVYGHGNSITVTNGGTINVQGLTYIGGTPSSSNNVLTVTGPRSLYQSGSTFYVGSNTVITGSGRVVVTDDGTLETPAFIGGFNSTSSITNFGGIYQFATAAPTITPNTAGSIAITDGTISYRDVSAANIYNGQVANMLFSGNNAFRLYNSTNSGVSAYTFDSVANTGTPTNYQKLVLYSGGARWQSARLGIGTGGEMVVSNAANAVVAAAVTNSGNISVVNSTVSWMSNVVVNGGYVSDPSTNTFLADVTVGQFGFMAGGPGDLFDFKKSLLIHSENNSVFDLIQSTVEFSGGGMHTNLITGIDTGTNGMYGGNFEYGTLRLDSASDFVCFGCGNIPTVASNGLYVGWLDLNDDTNQVANLRAPTTINLYYFIGDARNSYLNGQTYQLLDCDGNLGGLLMAAIPEPTTALLVLGAGLLLRRRK